LCRAKWGKNLRVFGSVARGEEKDTSDIDLLVDLPADITLITLEQLRYELEQILGARVDLATLDSLRPKARVEAERDAIAV
jgi:predicted nucleotidyltransferase